MKIVLTNKYIVMEEKPVKCEGCPYFFGSLACSNCILQKYA